MNQLDTLTNQLVNRLVAALINPLLELLFVLGLLLFAWGIVEFMWGLSKGGKSERVEQGKQHILYGVVGMFVMTAAWGIIRVVTSVAQGFLSQ